MKCKCGHNKGEHSATNHCIHRNRTCLKIFKNWPYLCSCNRLRKVSE